MSERRGAGIVPAIGWTLPILMVATGSSTARGDELSDLRADQELMQRRSGMHPPFMLDLCYFCHKLVSDHRSRYIGCGMVPLCPVH